MITAANIKSTARELGFDLCGIAAAADYPELGFLREWVDCGYAAGMDWMRESVDERADVRRLLPGARSVIVTGTLYNTARPYSGELPPETARIARYAWGDDYHDVLRARLRQLLQWMQTEAGGGFAAVTFVDTEPVQERVYAQYAGLGWIGKNSCLISPDLGSWLFLSGIVCTLDLEPDPQGLEQCGSCTRCLDACPTGALVEAGVLDSGRCISYLTIEHPGELPAWDAAAIGSHVYGCDICQEVCPYNQPAPVSTDSAWQPRAALDLPRLVELAGRNDAELRESLRGSAMMRARVSGLRRNVTAALANMGR